MVKKLSANGRGLAKAGRSVLSFRPKPVINMLASFHGQGQHAPAFAKPLLGAGPLTRIDVVKSSKSFKFRVDS